MAVDLLKFQELNENPFGFDNNELNSGKGIESIVISKNVCWHKSFRNRINSTEFKRVEKRNRENEESTTSSVKTRTSVGDSTEKGVEQRVLSSVYSVIREMVISINHQRLRLITKLGSML